MILPSDETELSTKSQPDEENSLSTKESDMGSISGPAVGMIANNNEEDETMVMPTESLEHILLNESYIQDQYGVFYRPVYVGENYKEHETDLVFEGKLYTTEGAGNCPFCKGAGKVTVEKLGLKDCPDCDGSGDIQGEQEMPPQEMPPQEVPQEVDPNLLNPEEVPVEEEEEKIPSPMEAVNNSKESYLATEEGDWITMNGNHIMVKDGQTKKQAIGDFLDNVDDDLKSSKKDKPKVRNPKDGKSNKKTDKPKEDKKTDKPKENNYDYEEYDDLDEDQMDNELKKLFDNYDYDLIKSQFNSDDPMASPEVDDDRMSLGSKNNIYMDQLAGQSGEIKDNAMDDYFDNGKGDKIIKDKLGDEYSLQVDGEDIYIVKDTPKDNWDDYKDEYGRGRDDPLFGSGNTSPNALYDDYNQRIRNSKHGIKNGEPKESHEQNIKQLEKDIEKLQKLYPEARPENYGMDRIIRRFEREQPELIEKWDKLLEDVEGKTLLDKTFNLRNTSDKKLNKQQIEFKNGLPKPHKTESFNKLSKESKANEGDSDYCKVCGDFDESHYNEDGSIRDHEFKAGGVSNESCGCKTKGLEASISKYEKFVETEINILKKRANEGESVGLMYGLPTVRKDGKKIKGTLAYAGVSLNDRIYLPEELAKGHGKTLPLLLNHSSTAGAEEELDRLDSEMRDHLENEKDYEVGEVTLTWDADKLTLFYEGVIENEFFQKEVDDMDMAVSLGIFYDSNSPKVCDENCYTLIKGAEFREVSLVYHAGFPIATIEAVEAKLKRASLKDIKANEDSLIKVEDKNDDDTKVTVLDEWKSKGEAIAEEEEDELPLGGSIDAEPKETDTIEQPMMKEVRSSNDFSVRGVSGMTISNSNGVEKYVFDPTNSYSTNMIHFSVTEQGGVISGEEIQMQPKMATPEELTKEIESHPNVVFTDPDENILKKN